MQPVFIRFPTGKRGKGAWAKRRGLEDYLSAFFLLTSPAASLKNDFSGQLAQLVEHRLHTAGVTGSSPVLPTMPVQGGYGFRRNPLFAPWGASSPAIIPPCFFFR